MKRNKEWWSNRTPQERYIIRHYERNIWKTGFRGGYLPDDCCECVICGCVASDSPCTQCRVEYEKAVGN